MSDDQARPPQSKPSSPISSFKLASAQTPSGSVGHFKNPVKIAGILGSRLQGPIDQAQVQSSDWAVRICEPTPHLLQPASHSPQRSVVHREIQMPEAPLPTLPPSPASCRPTKDTSLAEVVTQIRSVLDQSNPSPGPEVSDSDNIHIK